MRLYFDTAYVAKCYLNEPDGKSVRQLAMQATELSSSAWSVAELACVFHRHVREGAVTRRQATRMRKLFREHVERGTWNLLPVSEGLLLQVETLTASLPASIYLRGGDAVHLVTAQRAGFTEIWSNDKHLLAAAPRFGLRGRSV